MSNDIVERLLSDSTPEQQANLGILPSITNLMREAANEILQLRSTIEQLRRVAGAVSLESGLVDIKADLAKKKENPSHG